MLPMLPALLCCTVYERRHQASCVLSSYQGADLQALIPCDAMLQAAEEAQQRIEKAAAEAAKQAPEKGDVAAQVVRGTAQGVKREAVPTAEVRHRLQSCYDFGELCIWRRAEGHWGSPVPWELSRRALASCPWQDG